MSDWISVKERLPVPGTWVLCLCVSNAQEVLRWDNYEWYHDAKHIYFNTFVTHWMQLPNLPEGDK